MKSETITNAVEEHYAAVARGEASACGAPAEDVARTIGYSDEELAIAGDANLGLGCGNPLALTELKPGMTVLDLGSGAGFDAFLAWSRVGATGRVIGVDMTDDMLALARANAEKRGATNIEFRKGKIEQLPVESGTVDYVISNCVINLSSHKPAVFREIARVLKPGGRIAFSTWPPELLVGRMFALVARHQPPPAGVAPPGEWGDPTVVLQRLGTSVRDLEFHRETMTAPALSPQHYRSGLEVTIGPIAKVVAALSSDPDRLVKFRAELDALIDKYSSRNLVHQSYLMTRAIKRA